MHEWYVGMDCPIENEDLIKLIAFGSSILPDVLKHAEKIHGNYKCDQRVIYYARACMLDYRRHGHDEKIMNIIADQLAFYALSQLPSH